jgi:hypothetical protein
MTGAFGEEGEGRSHSDTRMIRSCHSSKPGGHGSRIGVGLIGEGKLNTDIPLTIGLEAQGEGGCLVKTMDSEGRGRRSQRRQMKPPVGLGLQRCRSAGGERPAQAQPSKQGKGVVKAKTAGHRIPDSNDYGSGRQSSASLSALPIELILDARLSNKVLHRSSTWPTCKQREEELRLAVAKLVCPTSLPERDCLDSALRKKKCLSSGEGLSLHLRCSFQGMKVSSLGPRNRACLNLSQLID